MKRSANYLLIILALAFLGGNIDVPEQCKGKKISCWIGACTSTLMYCPEIIDYDENSKPTGTRESCRNTVRCTKNCECEGYLEFYRETL